MMKATYDIDNLSSNIVKKDILKEVQQKVLQSMKEAIIPSMGPAGSNTLILKGVNAASLLAEYSKDGNKIIKSIQYQNPIEMSIQTEIENITRHIEHVVGDGTSSAVVLSSIIFDKLIERMHEKNKENPYQVTRDFQKAVENIKNEVMSRKRECTLEDIYNISLISTNGNEDIASILQDVYTEYGHDVFIDVSASLDQDTYKRDYNGLTIDIGYADNGYINTPEGTSRLSNPRIYAFNDPIDTPYMVSLFEQIIKLNIMDHLADLRKAIPTIIIAPRISRDMSGAITAILKVLHQYTGEFITQKPPLLIVTNIGDGVNMNHYKNIAYLCNCRLIGKYIDPELQKKDQQSGIAPTLENVVDGFVKTEKNKKQDPVTGEIYDYETEVIMPFYGTAALVESDASFTRFNGPDNMYKKDADGEVIMDADGMPEFSIDYNSLIDHLEAELKRTTSANELGMAGSYKRQLNYLKANMVELFVGGVSISDRDSLRDLVEDAVLNCRSASKHGVGYGANYEGWMASAKLKDIINCNEDHLHEHYELIYDAYEEITRIIYGTVISNEDELNTIIKTSIESGPYNIATKEFDKTVLTSIISDTTILDTISKIITLMFGSNQALLQSPQLNMY